MFSNSSKNRPAQSFTQQPVFSCYLYCFYTGVRKLRSEQTLKTIVRCRTKFVRYRTITQ